MKNHHLSKSIGDASWNRIIQYTTYKAESAGAVVVLVDPGTRHRNAQSAAASKKI